MKSSKKKLKKHIYLFHFYGNWSSERTLKSTARYWWFRTVQMSAVTLFFSIFITISKRNQYQRKPNWSLITVKKNFFNRVFICTLLYYFLKLNLIWKKVVSRILIIHAKFVKKNVYIAPYTQKKRASPNKL